MAWTVSFSKTAEKQFNKLDRQLQLAIRNYLRERIAPAADPRQFGKALTAELKGLWRYRVSDYRIICEIQDQRLVVLVVKIGHRGDVYR